MWTVDGHKKARHFLKGQTLGVYTLLVSFTPIVFAAWLFLWIKEIPITVRLKTPLKLLWGTDNTEFKVLLIWTWFSAGCKMEPWSELKVDSEGICWTSAAAAFAFDLSEACINTVSPCLSNKNTARLLFKLEMMLSTEPITCSSYSIITSFVICRGLGFSKMKRKNGFPAQPICMWSSAKTWEDKNPSFETHRQTIPTTLTCFFMVCVICCIFAKSSISFATIFFFFFNRLLTCKSYNRWQVKWHAQLQLTSQQTCIFPWPFLDNLLLEQLQSRTIIPAIAHNTFICAQRFNCQCSDDSNPITAAVCCKSKFLPQSKCKISSSGGIILGCCSITAAAHNCPHNFKTSGEQNLQILCATFSKPKQRQSCQISILHEGEEDNCNSISILQIHHHHQSNTKSPDCTFCSSEFWSSSSSSLSPSSCSCSLKS